MKKLSVATLVVVCVLIGRPASAATIIFDNCSVASLCNNLTITTTLNGSAIDVAVTAPSGYGIFGDSGANRAFGFNVSGSEVGLALSNLTPGFTFSGEDVNFSGGFGSVRVPRHWSRGHGRGFFKRCADADECRPSADFS